MGKRSRSEVDATANSSSALTGDRTSKKARLTDEEKIAKRKRKEARREAKAKQNASHNYPTPISTSAVSSVAQSTNNSSTATPEPGDSASNKYCEPAGLRDVPQPQIDDFITSKQIAIEEPGRDKPSLRPIIDFSFLPVTSEAERRPFASFSTPTPIQAAAWPYLFSGKDVIGVAETGSGKTLAFGLPCVRYISGLREKKQKGVRGLIVSPTRELALQIHEQLEKLAQPSGLQVACVYGGVSKDQQRAALKSANIVVATPGRLNDLLNEGSVSLSKAQYVVLDEADRMLDKGFEEDIRKIISSTAPPAKRQTLMFTATWPPSVRALASTFMTNPVKIAIGAASDDLRANTRIEQVVEVIKPEDKQERLVAILRSATKGSKSSARMLIFCLYKKEAVRVERLLGSRGFRAAAIHGDMSQAAREASLAAFKAGTVPLLVATDVAARGLDIPDVRLVVNVTFPLTAEDYVHRIGRTGRAGAAGKAITLFTEQDKPLAGALVNVLRAAGQPVPEELLKFGTAVKKKLDVYGNAVGEVDMSKKATKITFD